MFKNNNSEVSSDYLKYMIRIFLLLSKMFNIYSNAFCVICFTGQEIEKFIPEIVKHEVQLPYTFPQYNVSYNWKVFLQFK